MKTSNASWQLTNTTLTLRHLQREWPVCLRFSNSSTTCWWSWCYQYFVVRNHVCSPSFDCFSDFINNSINGNRFVLNLTIQNWRCGFWPQRFNTWWNHAPRDNGMLGSVSKARFKSWRNMEFSAGFNWLFTGLGKHENKICWLMGVLINWWRTYWYVVGWRMFCSSCTGGCMTFAFACIDISSWIEANVEFCKATLRNDLKVTSLCQKIKKKHHDRHQKDEKVCVCIPLSTSWSIWTDTVITINWLLQL